jgi:hypothetical protein
VKPSDWEDFIHSAEAEGSTVRIEVPKAERKSWPTDQSIVNQLLEMKPGSTVVQFDTHLKDGMLGVVKEMSNCGWLKVSFPGHPDAMVPGWYLQPVHETANANLIEAESLAGGQ